MIVYGAGIPEESHVTLHVFPQVRLRSNPLEQHGAATNESQPLSHGTLHWFGIKPSYMRCLRLIGLHVTYQSQI